jgi:hypothetical protein
MGSRPVIGDWEMSSNTIRVVVDQRGHIRNVVRPGDRVVRVRLPLEYSRLEAEDLKSSLVKLPDTYGVWLDCAGPRLVQRRGSR